MNFINLFLNTIFLCVAKAFEKINVDSIERILGIVEYYEIRLLDTLEVSRGLLGEPPFVSF